MMHATASSETGMPVEHQSPVSQSIEEISFPYYYFLAMILQNTVMNTVREHVSLGQSNLLGGGEGREKRASRTTCFFGSFFSFFASHALSFYSPKSNSAGDHLDLTRAKGVMMINSKEGFVAKWPLR